MIADTATFQEQLQEIEAASITMAWGAGRILSEQFGKQLSIEYKDKNQLDPVTSADKATQEFLVREITRLFPAHGILGEEGSDETDPAGPAPDFLWVLDPLDGTTNFLNGLPVYASSIGILHRGRPVVRGVVYSLALARWRLCAALPEGWREQVYPVGRQPL